MSADVQGEGGAGQNGRKRPHTSTVEPGSATPSHEPTSRTTEGGKRRRRKLSCETCQRLKCRCDFDPVTRTCHRCKTLRHGPTFPFSFMLFLPGGLSPQPRALTVTAFFLFAVFPADQNPSDDLVLSRKMNSTLYHRSQKWSRKQNSAQT
jgi:hypothetical protein